MAEQPIIDEHEAFARELVSLARKHGCDTITATFSLSGSRRFFENTSNRTRVSLGWCEGRHGAPGRISLRAEAEITLDEPDAGRAAAYLADNQGEA